MIRNNLAIVVVTYNRFSSFVRLMESIAKIKTVHKNIALVVSIDYNENNQDTVRYSKAFKWPFGDKHIIQHNQKLGLKKHILSCGDLTEKFGSVIILEDDLFVSPYFYDYTISATGFYQNESKVAGISLYAYERTESANNTFKPIYDGFDAFFMQFPSSWGQCWTRPQWKNFKQWLAENNSEEKINRWIPHFIKVWPETSWKKLFAAYIVSQDKYIVYPKIALSTNFGEVGQHHIKQLNIRQVDLLSNKMEFNFPGFNNSNSKYDVGFELKYEELIKLNPKLSELPPFEVDLYCKKNHSENDVILTTAKTKKTIHSFSNRLFPLINNAIFGVEGKELSLAKYKDVEKESVAIYKTKFLAEFKFLSRELLRLVYYKLKPKNK